MSADIHRQADDLVRYYAELQRRLTQVGVRDGAGPRDAETVERPVVPEVEGVDLDSPRERREEYPDDRHDPGSQPHRQVRSQHDARLQTASAATLEAGGLEGGCITSIAPL